MEIDRNFQAVPLSIGNNAAVSQGVEFEWAAGGAVEVPSAWTAANIGFQFSQDQSTWIIARDENGVALQISGIDTAAARGYAIPDKVFGFGKYLRLWSKSTSAETDVNQGAARSLVMLLKG